MTNATLRQALAYAERGWPVFPCQANRKTPATTHGYQDATTDERQITDWFTRRPGCNLAIATGTPGPDVLDIAAALWAVLYLQPDRTPALVSAQAEYQAWILPALAAQLMAETTRCGHSRTPAVPYRSTP